MDIVTDGFGFMLSMGDLFWVPFSYSTAARYLVFDQKVLGPQGVAGVLAVNALGYWIFRASNSEKNDFRNGHNPKGEYMCSFWSISLTFPPCRPQDYGYQAWNEATDRRMVGNVPTPQLPVRASLIIYILSADTTVAVIGLWLLHGPYQQALRPPSPTFTLVTLPFCFCIGKIVMMRLARKSASLFAPFPDQASDNTFHRYGDDWKKYKSIVRWKIFPGIY